MGLTRRQFVRNAGSAVAAASLSRLGVAGTKAELPRRPLGKTGWKASIYALGSAEMPGGSEAVRAVNELIDGGVNYLDTAPSYQGTRSESVLGEVLKTRRKEVYLATKTLRRDADGAYAEIKESLGRLQTKQIDTLQIHAVNDFGTLEAVLSQNGAIKGLERAKKEGLIRFIGITGHTRPEVFLKALDLYAFDSILVPVSALDASLSDFAEEVIPKAKKQGVAVVGMKSLKGIERAQGNFEAKDFIRFALSLPIDTLTIGLRQLSEAKRNLEIVRAFQPMSAGEKADLVRRMKPYANADTLWWKRR